jgi:hypothetical protein
MSVKGTSDLVQDVLTDCSVVASLCATTSRSERGLGEVCILSPRASECVRLIEIACFANYVSP